VLAQSRGLTVTTKYPSRDTSQKWAIIIGVGEYEDNGIGDLPNAVNDAVSLKDTLMSLPNGFPQENILLMTDDQKQHNRPTESNIRRQINSHLDLVAKEDIVLLYFAGHGVTENSELYLMPRDGVVSDIKGSGYAFQDVENRLKACAAKKKIFILDACHSGTGRNADNKLSPSAEDEFARAADDMVILASCKADQRSYEMPDTGHGAFTYFLLDGLNGQGDSDEDGYINMMELAEYTWNKTRRWAADKGLQQIPWKRHEGFGSIILGEVGTGGRLPVRPKLSAKEAAATYAKGMEHYRAELLKDAFREFELAAESGHLEAMARLAAMYYVGDGVAMNEALAFRWYSQAAKQDHAPAMNMLAYFADRGHGTPKSEAEALKWYKKAAAQGNARATDILKRRGETP
jgi:TPR repeat protein